MKRILMNLYWVGLLILLSASIHPFAGAQVPTMTADQARQVLLPYVQAPDQTLVNPAVSWPDYSTGHTMYLFYGAANGNGGRYQIDGATGEKNIQYVPTSTWDKNASDAPPLLSRSQLMQIATAFAQQHFPGYAASTGRDTESGREPQLRDGDSYSIFFGTLAPSGAELPIWCDVDLEEDTGAVAYYTELDLPVTVDTTPQITQDQAVAIGQQWIYQNISTDPAAGQFMSGLAPGDPPVNFKVAVDPLLNEALIYKIAFTACGLLVDAHTGAVVGEDGWASFGGPAATAIPKRTGPDREVMQTVRYGNSMITEHSAIATAGQVYLWSGFLKSLDIQFKHQKGWLLLSNGNKHLRLPVRTSAGGKGEGAWSRKGSLYVPLTVVGQLTDRVAANPQSGEVQIKLPVGTAKVAPNTTFPHKAGGKL